jgi:hypothetical protein
MFIRVLGVEIPAEDEETKNALESLARLLPKAIEEVGAEPIYDILCQLIEVKRASDMVMADQMTAYQHAAAELFGDEEDEPIVVRRTCRNSRRSHENFDENGEGNG